MAFKMKKQSMTQGTTAHKSALKMKAKQDAAMKMKREAAMKMKQEAAMKMKSPMELGKVGEFLKNTVQGKGVAGAIMNPVGAIANKLGGGGNEAQAATQQAQQQMQQPAPTMMKKESPTKLGAVKEGFKYAGKKLKDVKQGASDIKEGFRQLFTGDRTDSRKKKSPSKLRKPTGRKNMLMDTTEEAPKIKRGPESTKRGRSLKPMTKASKEGMATALEKGLKKRGKEMKGKTPGTGMRKMSAADRKKLENLGKKAPAKFNAKLKAASAAGKLSGEFKKAVDASPTKMKKKSPATKKGDYLSKAKDRVTNVVDMFKDASGKTNKGNRRSVGGKNVIDTYRDAYLKSKRKTDKKYKK